MSIANIIKLSITKQDGDGQFTAADAKVYWRKFKALLTNKLPDGAGFSLGFLFGIKHG
jgi:hypothetical protein